MKPPALRTIVLNVSLVLLSLFFSLGILEVALRYGLFYKNLIWNPREAELLNLRINNETHAFAEKNQFLFNDVEHTPEKPAGIYRVAILGDSFVWGDGVPGDKRWNAKVAARLKAANEKIEVMHWGRNGWSTEDEVNFLGQYGLAYSPDLILVNFTTNDLDLKRYPRNYFQWQYSRPVKLIGMVLPNAVNFLSAYINRFVESHSEDLGYTNWENKQYSPENMEVYQKLLKVFAQLCKKNGIKLYFVLVPNNCDPIFRQKFDAVIPLLKEAEIPFLDLYPPVVEKLKDRPVLDLWANRANGHPGEVLTEVIAEEVMKFLGKERILESLNSSPRKHYK